MITQNGWEMVSTNTSWRPFTVLIGASVVLTHMQHPTQTTYHVPTWSHQASQEDNKAQGGQNLRMGQLARNDITIYTMPFWSIYFQAESLAQICALRQCDLATFRVHFSGLAASHCPCQNLAKTCQVAVKVGNPGSGQRQWAPGTRWQPQTSRVCFGWHPTSIYKQDPQLQVVFILLPWISFRY